MSTKVFRFTEFDLQYAAEILSWVCSQEEALHWASLADFPVTDISIFSRWHSENEIFPFVLFCGNELCAYGELWIEESEGTAELARLIVAPQHRRKGVGRTLIEQLVDTSGRKGFASIWLRIVPTNLNAIACYTACGFKKGSTEQHDAFNVGQPHKYIWMSNTKTPS